MNKTLNIILVAVAIVVLAGAFFFAGSMYSRAYSFSPLPAKGYGRGDNYANVPPMMGRRGPGMMGGNGGRNNGNAVNAAPLTIDQAKQAAENYIALLNIEGLEIGEVMIFDNNAYVIVMESDTGIGAFELLVDPVSQRAFPEYGPNMMWNLKYGGLGHGGMMNGRGMMGGGNPQYSIPADVSSEMPITSKQAIEYAQKFLDTNVKGAIAADDPMQFYGYYTLDFEMDGKVIGMLSVNGYNGQVFLHTWHNTFIEESQ